MAGGGGEETNLEFAINIYILQVCVCYVTSIVSTLSDPMDCSPPGFCVYGDSSGKNTGMVCHALLQGIFLTQGSNPCLLCLLHWQVGPLSLVPPGKPIYTLIYVK